MKLVDVPLAALAARRALHPGTLVVTGLVAAALASTDWGPGTISRAALEAELGADGLGSLKRALTRQALWSGLVFWLLAVFGLHAARTIDGWKARGEVDWLGARPVSRLCVALSTWVGQTAALALLALGALALVEGVVRDAPATLREFGPVGPPESPWLDRDRGTTWRIPAVASAPRGAVFTFEASVSRGGPGMTVVAVCTGGDSATDRRIVGRGEVALPLTSDAVTIALLKTGFGVHAMPPDRGPEPEREAADVTGYVHPDSGRLWEPCDSERRASRNLAARLAFTGAALLAFALGLGAWMRGSLAALAVGAAWIGGWLWTAAPARLTALWPGARLVDALDVVGRGRVPAAIGVETWLGTAAIVALGLALATKGLAQWRRET